MRVRRLDFLDLNTISKNSFILIFLIVLIVTVYPPKSSEMDSEYWEKWADEHRMRGIGAPCDFGRIEVDAPQLMKAGETYPIVIHGWFRKTPLEPVKIRAIWSFTFPDIIENMGEKVQDVILQPQDSLCIKTNIRFNEVPIGLQVFCRFFAERPAKDDSLNIFSGDYWSPVGYALGRWNVDPLDRNSLIDANTGADRGAMARRRLKDRIDSAGQGTQQISNEAKKMIDTLVSSLDETRKRKLATVSEYLSEQTESDLKTAAEFVGRHARDWGKPSDCGTVAKAADKLIWLLEIGELTNLYRNGLETNESPVGEIWQYTRDAQIGKRGWLEVERKLDSLLILYPDDEDLNASAIAIRAMIEENNE